MKAAKKSFTLFAVLSVLCGIAAGTLLYINSMTGFDIAIGHFDSTPMFTAMVGCFIGALALALVGALMLVRRASSVRMPKYNFATTATATLAGIVYAATGVFYGIYPIWVAVAHFAPITDGFVNVVREVARYLSNGGQLLSVISGLLCFLCAACFVIFSGEKKTERARASLMIFVVIRALLESLLIYFDKSRTINSPIKALLLFGSVALMMFLCEEIRFYIGNQIAPLYGFFVTVAASVGIAIYVPGTIAAVMRLLEVPTSYVFGSVEGIYEALGLNIIPMVVGLVVTLFAVVRLCTFGGTLGEYVPKPKQDKKSAKAAEAVAAKTAEAVAEIAEEKAETEDKE